jgi:hypothetical protein
MDGEVEEDLDKELKMCMADCLYNQVEEDGGGEITVTIIIELGAIPNYKH